MVRFERSWRRAGADLTRHVVDGAAFPAECVETLDSTSARRHDGGTRVRLIGNQFRWRPSISTEAI